MTDGDLIALARTLQTNGAAIVVSIDCVGGATSRILPPEDLPGFLASPDRWAAGQWSVTPAQFADWKLTGGFPRCRASTQKGTPCRNPVSGSACDPPQFAELDGGLCHVHG